MNFLQLCQRVRQEAGGIAGGINTPSTVTNQVGQLANVVNWTNDAWRDLQLKHDDWRWKRKDFTMPISAASNDYAASVAGITDFAKWIEGSFRLYRTSAGIADEQFLTCLSYNTWRDVWDYGVRTPSRPNSITIKPTDRLGFGPLPDDDYTLVGEYWSSGSSMTIDADVPIGLPEDFHMAIVYRALKKYAVNEAAPEIYASFKDEHTRVENKLERQQLPRWTTGGALA